MKQRYILSIFFLLLAISSLAQRTKIFGLVKDDDGQPLELANVRILGTSILTSTNLKGEYTLYCTSRDSVVVVYSQIGYETRKRLLRNPGDSIRLDIVLPAYGNTLNTAVVIGQAKQTTTEQRIKLTDQTTMPSTTGNGVEEIIATQAGVSTHNELSSQYNVRGGSFDENVVYLNGLEIFRPMLVRSGQQEGLSVINSDMVEKIGFSSGGFEARYGDKMSSVLDITYKRPTGFEGRVNGSMLGGGIYLGGGNSKFSLMTSLRYKTTRYLLGSLETTGEYNPNFLDYQAYLSWSPNRRWTIDVLGNISDHVGGGIMPLGGNTEQLGSHKGYGYGMLCEIFASIFSQGGTSNKCMTGGRSNICHGFMAINPAIFGNPEEVKKHFSTFLQELREAPKAEGAERIYTHGEKEAEAIEVCRKEGVPVIDKTVAELFDVCELLKLDPKKYFGDYEPPKAVASNY